MDDDIRDPRDVEMPDMPGELREALEADHVALGAFDALPPSHRREHVAYVAEAKDPEARRRRARKTVEALLEERTQP